MILQNSIERVFSSEGVEEIALGLYVVRGDNMYAQTSSTHSPIPGFFHSSDIVNNFSMVVGEVDEDRDGVIEWEMVKADPLPEMRRHGGYTTAF